MRSVFCLIMALYVLLLSVLPCADGCQSVHAEDSPTQLAADHQSHDGGHADGDLCSPLCSCACCGMVTSQPPVFAFTFTPPTPVAQHVLTGDVPPLPSVARSTWQPPQRS